MRKTQFFIIILFFTSNLIQAQTTPPISQEVEIVLKKAGKNRIELEKVLKHYQSDPEQLKWEAACYLIKSMDIHYTETFYWINKSGEEVDFNELEYSSFSESIKAFNELNLKSELKPVISKEFDIEHIKGDYLINNIERAFKTWQAPQNKHLTFEEFCEYLLPYRILTEKLEEWWESYGAEFSPKNILSSKLSIYQLANLLNNKISSSFISSYSYEDKKNPVTFLSPSQMLFRKRGHCEDIVNFTLLAFKSQGLPSRIDMVPYHGTSTGRHYWNATIDEEHQLVPFESTNNSIKNFYLKREPAKVITLTYAKQPDALASLIPQKEIPKGFLRNYNYKDVTEKYWPVKDLECAITHPSTSSIAYISVLNGLQWRPVFWGEINNAIAHFPKMGCGVAYLPMIYADSKLQSAGYPTLLFENKEVIVAQPDPNDTYTLTLEEELPYLKYRTGKLYKLYYWDHKWKLIGKQKASTLPSLTFENVPKNALFLLIPEYTQKKERPFYITPTGERLWW